MTPDPEPGLQTAEDRLRRWRLILGAKADTGGEIGLDGVQAGMDRVLEALYDADRRGNLGPSSPSVNRWLGDIRTYFPTPVVQMMQKDALQRLGLERMLLEPELLESVTPDVHLAAALLSLGKMLPDKTRETARMVIRKVVEQIELRMRFPLEQAIRGSLNRADRNFKPRPHEINWPHTVKANLQYYQPELNAIIPHKIIGYGHKRRQMKSVILLIDQSGSMASSAVYAGVAACVMASIRSLRTHIVVFDVNVVDLTERLSDPVELLFGIQLGGGTDIARALRYGAGLIQNPAETTFLLISDLFEGGSDREMLSQVARIKSSGVNLITLLALNDEGAPAFDRNIAGKLAALGIPAFACTPDLFPSLMAAALHEEPVADWMGRNGVSAKN